MLKRKDDIRRRLTIAEVPKPPVDLAHKIKRDIPKHYTSKTAKEAGAQQKRASLPLWNFWGFSWQLAAGILVLIGLTWATFETWRTEVVRTAQIAESDPSGGRDALKNAPAATSVAVGDEVAGEQESSLNERLESQVGGYDDAAVAGSDAPRTREQRLDQAQAMAPSAPGAAKPRQSNYAPDSPGEIAGRRSNANAEEMKRAAAEPTVDSMKVADLADAPEPTTAGTGVEGGVGGEVRGAVVGGVIAEAPARVAEGELSKDDRAAAKSAPAVSFAAREVAVQEAESDHTATYAVVVKGLTVERVVKVELQLDTSGRVTELRVLDNRDPNVIEAVTKASKEWVVSADRDASGTKGRTTTIDVRLRQDK